MRLNRRYDVTSTDGAAQLTKDKGGCDVVITPDDEERLDHFGELRNRGEDQKLGIEKLTN